MQLLKCTKKLKKKWGSKKSDISDDEPKEDHLGSFGFDPFGCYSILDKHKFNQTKKALFTLRKILA